VNKQEQKKYGAWKPGWRRPVLALLCAIFIIAAFFLPGLRELDNRLYDLRAKWIAARIPTATNVVLIALDDRSLTRMEPAVGRWPWPRAVFAGVLDYCADARAVIFDIIFPEADWQYAGSDDLFAGAVKTQGHVVSAIHLDRNPGGGQNHPPSGLPFQERFVLQMDKKTLEGLTPYQSALLPYPALARASAALGSVNFQAESDGVVRRYKAVVRWRDHVYPSLALAAWAVAHSVDISDIRLTPRGLAAGEWFFPLNRDGTFYYCQSAERPRIFGMIDVLDAWRAENESEEPRISRDEFRDKIVVIGSFATGLQGDWKVTPLDPREAGMEIGVSALDCLQTGRHYRVFPVWMGWLLTVLLACIPAALRLDRPWFMTATASVMIAGYTLVVLLVLKVWWWMVPMAMPLAGGLLSCIALGLLYWYAERRRRRAIEALDKAKQQFTDMLVHDLKGRTSSITMALGMLTERLKDNDETVRSLLDTARTATGRLSQEIHSLLDIRKMQEGRLPLTRLSVNVNEFLESLVLEYETTARISGAGLVYEASDKSLVIQADLDVFSRIMGNLLWNALQYAKSGTSVVMGSEQGPNGEIIIWVANRGAEVPEEERTAVFEPFVSVVRLHRNIKLRGTGLGLAFCRLAMEAHGGNIRLESPWTAYGDGVKVILTFPPK